MMHIIRKAEVFATAAHAAVGQRRKYTGEPYIVHPREVSELVRSFGGDDAMIAAAWLHDVVEDTGVTLEDVGYHFGEDIFMLVYWLTDISKPEDGNREYRKGLDRAHTAMASGRAQTIKCCDLISNTSSIAEHDKDFARVYLVEKHKLLDVLHQADPNALLAARNVAREARKMVDAAVL